MSNCASDADVLFHDAQLVAEELAAEAYFGHSAAEYAVSSGAAREGGARRLFHHKPSRIDDELDEIGHRFDGGPPRDGRDAAHGLRPVSARSALDAAVVGSGPNGLRRRPDPGARGTLGRGLRGGATPGRRMSNRGADAARVPPRRLLDHPVDGAVRPVLSRPRRVARDARGVRLLTPEVALQATPWTAARHDALGRRDREGIGPRRARLRGLATAATVGDRRPSRPASLAPLRTPPRNPLTMARFALAGLLGARACAKRFATAEARALVAGLCAHAMLPSSAVLTAAFGLFFTVTAHDGGWPVVEGGSDR